MRILSLQANGSQIAGFNERSGAYLPRKRITDQTLRDKKNGRETEIVSRRKSADYFYAPKH